MITLAGKKYARNSAEMTESLFAPDGTCNGYYREHTGGAVVGILFMDLQRKPFAFAAKRGASAWFVTAGRDASGRIRYMFGTDEIVERQLGIDQLKHSEQRDEAMRLCLNL